MRRTPATRTGLTVLAGLSALALVAGCAGGGDDPEPTSDEPTTEETTSEEPTDEPTEPTEEPSSGGADDDADAAAPEFPGDTADSTGTGQAATELVLVDVRTGSHDGYDRLVLEFSGSGTPGWTVGYVPEAVRDGSGEVVPLDGDAVLDVVASDTTMPMSQEEYYDGPRTFEVDGEALEAVYVDGVFEGLTHVMVGVDDGASVFRVFTLTEPSRLVVDVADVDS